MSELADSISPNNNRYRAYIIAYNLQAVLIYKHRITLRLDESGSQPEAEVGDNGPSQISESQNLAQRAYLSPSKSLEVPEDDGGYDLYQRICPDPEVHDPSRSLRFKKVIYQKLRFGLSVLS